MLGSFPFVVFGRIGSASLAKGAGFWLELRKNSANFALSTGMAFSILYGVEIKTFNSNRLAFYSFNQPTAASFSLVSNFPFVESSTPRKSDP
jgi:hypothetical protein